MLLRELLADPGAQSVYGIDRLFGEWRNSDRDQAREAIAAMEPGSPRDRAVAGWCVADRAPEEALPMAELYPEAFNDDLVFQLAADLAEPHALAAGLELTRRMQDPARQQALRERLLVRWSASGESGAQEWISTAADLDAATRERLTAALKQSGGAAGEKSNHDEEEKQ